MSIFHYLKKCRQIPGAHSESLFKICELFMTNDKQMDGHKSSNRFDYAYSKACNLKIKSLKKPKYSQKNKIIKWNSNKIILKIVWHFLFSHHKKMSTQDTNMIIHLSWKTWELEHCWQEVRCAQKKTRIAFGRWRYHNGFHSFGTSWTYRDGTLVLQQQLDQLGRQ